MPKITGMIKVEIKTPHLPENSLCDLANTARRMMAVSERNLAVTIRRENIQYQMGHIEFFKTTGLNSRTMGNQRRLT